MSGPRASVLFACGLNRVRSPMAAGLMRRLQPWNARIASCGVHPDPDGLADPFAVAVMTEIGVDIAAHAPRIFEDLAADSFDVIVSLSADAQQRASEFGLARAAGLEFWPTPDPTVTSGSRETILDAYRAVRDALDRRIRERFASQGAGA